MATKKKPSRRSSGLLIDVARVVSVGHDRSTGQAILRFRDDRDRIVASRLRPGSSARSRTESSGWRRRWTDTP